MRILILAATLAATAAPSILIAQPAMAEGYHDNGRHEGHYKKDKHDHREWRQDRREDRRDHRIAQQRRAEWQSYNRYDYNRPDPRFGGYDAARYYRDDRSYGERRLTRNDRVYRGNDGRYYCRRSDGTTGLIIGAVAGGLLGNALDNGRSSTLGTILGDRGQARCR
jgi:Ni/Co efflux regulator RcnB